MVDLPPPNDPTWCASCWARHNGGHIVGQSYQDKEGVCDGCGRSIEE